MKMLKRICVAISFPLPCGQMEIIELIAVSAFPCASPCLSRWTSDTGIIGYYIVYLKDNALIRELVIDDHVVMSEHLYLEMLGLQEINICLDEGNIGERR